MALTPAQSANELFTAGRSHALSADLLFRAAISEGESRDDIEDVENFAFNGSYSLSTFYLLGLGLELMLKAAIISYSDRYDRNQLHNIGHDLIGAHEAAQNAGFRSAAPRLAELVAALDEPYRRHWLRYERPARFVLPGDFVQVVETLEVLDEELRNRLWQED